MSETKTEQLKREIEAETKKSIEKTAKEFDAILKERGLMIRSKMVWTQGFNPEFIQEIVKAE